MVDMFPVLRVLGILIMVFALTMGLPATRRQTVNG